MALLANAPNCVDGARNLAHAFLTGRAAVVPRDSAAALLQHCADPADPPPERMCITDPRADKPSPSTAGASDSACAPAGSPASTACALAAIHPASRDVRKASHAYRRAVAECASRALCGACITPAATCAPHAAGAHLARADPQLGQCDPSVRAHNTLAVPGPEAGEEQEEVPSLPMLEGWVQKEGNVVSFRPHVYARLRYGVLSYGRDAQSKPKERVVLQGLDVRSAESENSVRVERDTGTLQLIFSSADEQRRWLDALRLSAAWTLEDLYATECVIAEGASATVRSAKRLRSGQTVAVKSVDKGATSGEREVTILRDDKAHMNLLRALDVLETETHVHIALPLMNGGSLRDTLRTSRTLSESDARRVLWDILHGLMHLHARGVVHRDLKPDNILQHFDGGRVRAVIGDFGLSAFMGADGTVRRSGAICGTPQYAAPETIRGHAVGPGVDLWACGVMLYEMLTGRLPFVSDNYEGLFAKIKLAQFNIKQLAHERCSVAARSLVMQLLQAHPDKRISVQDALAHDWFRA